MISPRASAESGWTGSPTATRFTDRCPHHSQRCTSTRPLPLRWSRPTGRIGPPQSAARSPAWSSRCRDHRQCGQWLRKLPDTSGSTTAPHWPQLKEVFSADRDIRLEMVCSAQSKDRHAWCRVPFVLTRRSGLSGWLEGGTRFTAAIGDYFQFLLHRCSTRRPHPDPDHDRVPRPLSPVALPLGAEHATGATGRCLLHVTDSISGGVRPLGIRPSRCGQWPRVSLPSRLPIAQQGRAADGRRRPNSDVMDWST